MGDTVTGNTVRIDGAGSYDRVDCEEFRVNGTGKVDGDVLASVVRVNGTAKVGGRVDAGELAVDGTAKIEERVRAETVEVDGTAKFRGDVTADEFAGDGTVKVDGDASIDSVTVDGTAKVRGNLDGHRVESDGTAKVSGSLVASSAAFDGTGKVGGLTDVTELRVDGTGKFGDVNAETLTASGSLRADRLDAREFDLVLDGDSAVDAVRANDVRVRRSEGGSAVGSLGSKLLNQGDPVLEVGVVEGETVELDATEAETVVGERVTLGPAARVGAVYTDDLDADDDAQVGDVRPLEDC